MTNYTQSPEFRRVSGQATEDTLKVVFKWVGIAIAQTANAVKHIIMSLIGKS